MGAGEIMERERYILYTLILPLFIVLTACNQEKAYEVTKSEIKVTESKTELQLEVDYELRNYTDEDYYYTFVFPSYIQEALITKVDIGKLVADSSLTGVRVIAVSKDGAEMTEETIDAILNGELPAITQILIGKTVSLK